MAVVVDETMIMTVKAWDRVYVTSLLRNALLPFIKAAYTRILDVRILWLIILLCDLIHTVYASNSNKSKFYTWRNFCSIYLWDFICLRNVVTLSLTKELNQVCYFIIRAVNECRYTSLYLATNNVHDSTSICRLHPCSYYEARRVWKYLYCISSYHIHHVQI
jgi:hypothetical protein